MAKNRDWVDYTNVAANVVQTVQLDGINSKMRQLAELELLKEFREQQEAAVTKCEDLLRDAVFYFSEQLRDLEEVASQNAVTAYIRASHLKAAYGRMPQFKASGFRKFEDKDRLADVQRVCDRLIRESASRLKLDELELCDGCVVHIFERDDLLRLIAVQEEKEQLAKERESLPAWQAAKQAELERAKQEQQLATPFWFRLAVKVRNGSAICTATGLVWLGVVLLLYGSKELPFLVTVPVWLLVTTPFLFLTFIVVVFSPPERCRREFEKRLSQKVAEIETRGFEISQREAELKASEHLYAKFGTTSAQGSRELLSTRDKLLVEIMGESAQEFVERKQALGYGSL